MKAVVYHGKKDIRLQDWDEPIPGPADLKLRVTYCGICATDIEEWQFGPLWVQHDSPNPLTGAIIPIVLGHEITGVIVEPTDRVSRYTNLIGKRVVVNNILTCGNCFWCLRGWQAVCPQLAVAGFSADGGLQEFMVWPEDKVIKLPDSIPEDEGSLLEPATIAVHAVRKSGAKPGDTVAVFGVGTVGILTIQILISLGIKVIAIDKKQKSLNLAKKMGVWITVNNTIKDPLNECLELTNGIGPDIVLETSGANEIPAEAIRCTRRGGTTILVGIYSSKAELDFNDIVGSERTVKGAVAADPGDMEIAVDMAASGQIKLSDLVSKKVPLSNVIKEGFEPMLNPNKDVYRILIQPTV